MKASMDATEPLLQDVQGPPPTVTTGATNNLTPEGGLATPDNIGSLLGASNGSDEIDAVTLPLRVVPEGGDLHAMRTNLIISVVILSKTIVGAGMAALPRAFALLGLAAASCLLLLMGWFTHFTNDTLARGTLRTGHMSYPGVAQALLGRPASALLELCLVFRCAGLMLVYMIVTADILAGSDRFSGLLCDLIGSLPWCGWCSSRPLAVALVIFFVLVPLVSFKRLKSTALSSWIGMFAVACWSLSTIILVIAAVATGQVQHVHFWPDLALLGPSTWQRVTQVFAVLPILATAYTCQMTVHFVYRDLTPFNLPRAARVSSWAVSVCSAMFLIVAIGSYAVFGQDVPADVLQTYTPAVMSPLIGRLPAVVMYVAVRLSFLASVITLFPMQMWPYRESFTRLTFGRDMDGPMFYVVTYVSLMVIYLLAMALPSIWKPLQLIGATAGALIAFIFPAMITLTIEDRMDVKSIGRVAAAWALVVVGLGQFFAGIAAGLFLPDPTGEGSPPGHGMEVLHAGAGVSY